MARTYLRMRFPAMSGVPLPVLFGPTDTLHAYFREGTFNLAKIRRRQFNFDCS